MLKSSIYIFILILLVSIIIYTLSLKENDVNEMDLLWSKGLKNKDSYALKKTQSKSSDQEILNIIKNKETNKWIRSVDIETFSNNIDSLSMDTVLITGDDDMSIPADLDKKVVDKIVNCKKIIRWYTQNYTLNEHKNIKAYPIGFDLHTNRNSIISRFFFKGNPKETYDKLNNYNIDKSRKLKIFCDVHLNINNPERKRVYDILKNEDHFDTISHRKGIDKLWQYYQEYQFVISTHGNGLDCHRTWEILYLGGIVITKSSSLDSLYENLPVVIVKDWDECKDINNLKKWKQKFETMTNREYLKPYFKYHYWLNR